MFSSKQLRKVFSVLFHIISGAADVCIRTMIIDNTLRLSHPANSIILNT